MRSSGVKHVHSSKELPDRPRTVHLTPQEEIDQKSVIRLTWRKLLEVCERVTDMLQSVQGKYKRQLIRNVKVRAGTIFCLCLRRGLLAAWDLDELACRSPNPRDDCVQSGRPRAMPRCIDRFGGSCNRFDRAEHSLTVLVVFFYAFRRPF